MGDTLLEKFKLSRFKVVAKFLPLLRLRIVFLVVLRCENLICLIGACGIVFCQIVRLSQVAIFTWIFLDRFVAVGISRAKIESAVNRK